MKKKLIILSVIASVFAVSMTSCKKKVKGCTDSTATNYNPDADEDDGSCIAPTPTAAQPSTYSPTFSGIYSALVAIKTVSTVVVGNGIPDQTIEIGTAAAFFSENGGQSFVDVGNLDIAGNSLTKQTNNTYMYIPSNSNPTGIVFGDNYTWHATGNGSIWPSFSVYNGTGFANIDKITSGNVTLSNNYTLTSSSISNADSIYFAIHGTSKSKYVIVAGNLGNSYTFSSSDLSGLGKGKGFVQIVGINYKYDYPYNLDGKDYFSINETVQTKSVDLN